MEGYLERLRSLHPIRSARFARARDGAGTLAVGTRRRTYRLDVVEYARRLPALVAATLVRAQAPRLVAAPVIAGQAARLLAEAGTNYVDLAGNCHLVLADEVYVHIEGNVLPRPAPADRGIRAAGYQVLFSYLADNDVTRPVRAVGERAGTSRQAALEMRDRLVDEGYFLDGAHGLAWNPRRKDDALRRWLEGYQATVRPRLLVGSFRTRSTAPRDVAAVLQAALGPPGDGWRWGGSAAGYALRRHYRGERTVIHVDDDAIPANLPAARAPEGNLVVLRSFGAVDRDRTGLGDTAHPLLVYSELLTGDDERAREAAADLFDALIRPTWGAS